jgi:hypothetical protein
MSCKSKAKLKKKLAKKVVEEVQTPEKHVHRFSSKVEDVLASVFARTFMREIASQLNFDRFLDYVEPVNDLMDLFVNVEHNGGNPFVVNPRFVSFIKKLQAMPEEQLSPTVRALVQHFNNLETLVDNGVDQKPKAKTEIEAPAATAAEPEVQSISDLARIVANYANGFIISTHESEGCLSIAVRGIEQNRTTYKRINMEWYPHTCAFVVKTGGNEYGNKTLNSVNPRTDLGKHITKFLNVALHYGRFDSAKVDVKALKHLFDIMLSYIEKEKTTASRTFLRNLLST